ncbi:hypothetical protein BDZ91DRAFT_715516 [Kalaharituber pfeilii]|nr:hypothetical protein BDZ91DRAFT_715516 [Kalaharituber pfeilii]
MDRPRRRELRRLNGSVWDGQTDVFQVNKSLDSALKKNTAFIKRLRTGITASAQSTFLTEIRTLSLHKYLSEIIAAFYEGLCKLKTSGEIAAGVEVASALHQRFGPDEFTKQLGWLLGRGMSAPDKAQIKSWSQDMREREEKERLARHRVLLRVVTELWLVGVLRSLEDVERPEDAKGKDGAASMPGKSADGSAKNKALQGTKGNQDKEAEPFPLEVLKDLLGYDREHLNLPLAVLFARSYSWDILGSRATGEGRKTVEADGATTTAASSKDAPEAGSGDESAVIADSTDDPSLISDGMQQRFKNILNRYLEDVKKHIVRDQNALSNQNRRNAETYVKVGEILEDRQANFKKQTKAHEKLVSNAQVLCEVLGSEMPDLGKKEGTDATASGSIGLVKTGEYLRGQGEGAGIWEDEEERRFYENLADLKGKVPAVLLEDGKKKKTDGELTNGAALDTAAKKEDMSEEAQPEQGDRDGDEQSTAIANKNIGAQVDALLAKLPELQNKDAVDQLALDFCFLNSKASRNRLILIPLRTTQVPSTRVT